MCVRSSGRADKYRLLFPDEKSWTNGHTAALVLRPFRTELLSVFSCCHRLQLWSDESLVRGHPLNTWQLCLCQSGVMLLGEKAVVKDSGRGGGATKMAEAGLHKTTMCNEAREMEGIGGSLDRAAGMMPVCCTSAE